MNDSRGLAQYRAPRYWAIWAGIGLMRTLPWLPRRLQLALGRGLGALMHTAMRGRRAIARRNIELCFPELPAAEHRRIAREHFANLGISLTEMALAWWGRPEEVEPLVRFEGAEHIAAALASERPIIYLTGHFTPLEFGGTGLVQHSPPFDAVYREHRNGLIDELLRRGRETMARCTIEKSDIRSMVRALRAGVPVWYAPDQSYRRKQSALVPFFGVAAMTNTATSALAKLTGAVVLPFFIRRLPDDSAYLMEVLAPMENFPSDDPAADALAFNRLLEAQIRKAPAQYYWVHRKFKGRPPEYPDAYAELDT